MILAGRILVELDRNDQAADAFLQAARMCVKDGLTLIEIHAQAGTALLALANERGPQAQTFADRVLNLHQQDPESAADLPIWVILTTWQALGGREAEQTRALIGSVWERLEEKAAWISNAVFERSFWENVSAHQRLAAIRKAYESGD